MREVNPQHDVLCPEGHVIFKWMALNSYKIMGHYFYKEDETHQSFYSCPNCGDVDIEEHDLPTFHHCVFDGPDMPNLIRGAFTIGLNGIIPLPTRDNPFIPPSFYEIET